MTVSENVFQEANFGPAISAQVGGGAGKSVFSDIAALRSAYNSSARISSVELLISMDVRKPKKTEWFRVHPSDEMQLIAGVHEDQETREVYFIAPNMLPEMQELGVVTPAILHLAITRQNVPMIFLAKLPAEGSSGNSWYDTALTAAARAKQKWTRMAADMSLGAYRLWDSLDELQEPSWPDKPFNELLEVAFKNRVIDNTDHPVIKKLMGRS